MKKVKIISALMAAVLAAVPVTGAVNNVPLFKIDPVVANADKIKQSYVYIEDNGESFTSRPNKPIISSPNNIYKLYFRNGMIVITRSFFVLGRHTEIITWSYKSNGDLLAMQNDGNLVVYNNSKGIPTDHSNTYSRDNYYTTKYGSRFYYELTNDGRFIIRFRSEVGREEIRWDSSKDRMYKIG